MSLNALVLADPDADEPRLRCARDLDTRGDPRGEFIRLQIEAARQPLRFGGSPSYARLTEAADALLEQHRTRWLGTIAAKVTSATFLRGFIERIAIPATTFLASATELYALAPIRNVVFENAREAINELALTPHLQRLVKITLQQTALRDADLKTLVASPFLHKLKVLDIAWNDVGIEGLEALCAASSRLPNLIYVNLRGNAIDTPMDDYSQDSMNYRVVAESVRPTALGQRLEASYGPQPWMHAPLRLENLPPDDDEL